MPVTAPPRRGPITLWQRPTRSRAYTAERGAPRARRATDGLLLAASTIGIWVFGLGAAPLSAFEKALIELAASIPPFLDIVWRTLAGGSVAWAAFLVVASLLRWRLDILRDHALAATAAYLAADRLAGYLGSTELDDVLTPVSLRLAVVAAVCVMASPHLARPFRTTSRWILAGGGAAVVVLGATTPSGAILGVLCGTAAAAIVHLVFGSNGGRPPLSDVAEALQNLGIDATEISEAQRQIAGVFLVDAVDHAARPLQVKVYGRDAWDSQLLAKLWRTFWYRQTGALTLTRLQQAEHEAFVTLLAERHGVPVDEVINAGRSGGRDALIVIRRTGTPIDALATPAVPAALLHGMWDSVLTLQATGIAHGDLGLHRFNLRGDEVVITGFEAATVSATGDQQRSDLAQLLVTTALLAGVGESLDVARARIGADGLTDVLPYLQSAALGPQLRAALEAAELDLDEVRAAAADAAGTDPPALANLYRISKGTLARAALLSVAAYFLISTLAEIDVAEVADALRDAEWGLLAVALVFGQSPRLGQALATRGACPRPIAYGPVALLQYAIGFVNLVLPSTAARVGVNIRFFQRQGIPPASAVSIGVIDSLGGFAVEMAVLASMLIFGSVDLDFDLDRIGDSGGSSLLLWVTVGIAAAGVAAALICLAVPALRRRIVERVRPWVEEVRETVGNLRSPAKMAQVIGGNLISEILLALTLAVVLASLHESLPLGTLLVINVCVSLFAGFMPVPGGIGVTEGAMMLGLTAAGLDDATAFAATIAYRLITYYLPPIWGALALRRLEREGLL